MIDNKPQFTLEVLHPDGVWLETDVPADPPCTYTDTGLLAYRVVEWFDFPTGREGLVRTDKTTHFNAWISYKSLVLMSNVIRALCPIKR